MTFFYSLPATSGTPPVMVIRVDNLVAWALLSYELSDAQEHLQQLLSEMRTQPDFSEEEYRIWVAHIYAHLNRAWNRRNLPDKDTAEPPSPQQSHFPGDITPL